MNRKRIWWLVIPAMMAFGAETVHAQARSIDAAVQHVANEISFGVRAGATIALSSVNSGTLRMSSHLTNGITEALLNTGRVTLVDWARQREGVEYTVAVDLETHVDGFRLVAQVTRVAGAVIQGIHSSIVMRNDPVVVSLLGPTQPAVAGAGQVAVAGMPMRGGFTDGQRWVTFWLNMLVPGLGSFVIMRDTFGGVFQAITGFGGYFMFWYAFFIVWDEPPIVIGLISHATWVIFNIVRSITFSRAIPMVSNLPEQWNIALIPSKSGIEKVEFTHTLRF